jgi:CRISPR-associated protein Cas1
MAVMSLLIDRRGSEIALHNTGVVEVRHEDGTTHRIGLSGLRRIIVQGDARVSASLLRAGREHGVAFVLAAGRGRGETAHLFPEHRAGLALRLAQYRAHLEPDRRLALARALVHAKLEQQVLWLEAQGLDAATVRRFLAEAGAAPGIPELMGVEGAAAARYFALWGRLWREPWRFTGRNRRPPRDPVNALLSLSYMLALNRVGQMAALRGLDPALGFLHAPLNGRPALALDLLEPVRPWVDQWVWRLLERGALRPDDFTDSAQEGCRLSKEGRAVYYREWHVDEDQWLPRPARHALAIVLHRLRELRPALGEGTGP